MRLMGARERFSQLKELLQVSDEAQDRAHQRSLEYMRLAERAKSSPVDDDLDWLDVI